MSRVGLALLVVWALVAPGVASADLGPADVFILANADSGPSIELAEYYAHRRGVPREHIVSLPMPLTEEVSRADFDRLIRDPLRARLAERRGQVKVLLTVNGVPLRVAAQSTRPEDERRIGVLKQERAHLEPRLRAAKENLANKQTAAKENPALSNQVAEAKLHLDRLTVQDRKLDEQIILLSQDQSVAAVDSELALLWWGDYPLARWLPNPLHWQFSPARRMQAPPVVMTCRLDGPSLTVIKRMIDDALAVESDGDLTGHVYVDGKGDGFDVGADPTGTSYGGYDESLRELYRLAQNEAGFPATYEPTSRLFPAGSCPDAVFYCGWYSLASYIPSNQFVRGAVAVHIASLEAVSLRAGNRYWCPNLLMDGAAATMGAVAEPYLFAFPRPAEFFGFLMTGRYTLVECYFRTLPVNSWQMVLLGDPLYNPFRNKPRLKIDQIKPSPRGSRFPYG
ncbi:MAG TPA: TIGR03790 family protein [Gemmatales bacterium]|nr:TIGR03790 family protein [Gemmatales bacterium]HMP58083.1 TIGR03790 family protein [Gemmatales bacterium]